MKNMTLMRLVGLFTLGLLSSIVYAEYDFSWIGEAVKTKVLCDGVPVVREEVAVLSRRMWPVMWKRVPTVLPSFTAKAECDFSWYDFSWIEEVVKAHICHEIDLKVILGTRVGGEQALAIFHHAQSFMRLDFLDDVFAHGMKWRNATRDRAFRGSCLPNAPLLNLTRAYYQLKSYRAELSYVEWFTYLVGQSCKKLWHYSMD